MADGFESLVLKETTDFRLMRQLALSSGLEDGDYSNFIKAFGFYDHDALVACAGLKSNCGVFSLECVAVKDELRGRGLGRRLVSVLEDEARMRGAHELWALARAPEFFEKVGYQRMPQGTPGGPTMTACLVCGQYQRNCHPSLMLKKL